MATFLQLRVHSKERQGGWSLSSSSESGSQAKFVRTIRKWVVSIRTVRFSGPLWSSSFSSRVISAGSGHAR